MYYIGKTTFISFNGMKRLPGEEWRRGEYAHLLQDPTTPMSIRINAPFAAFSLVTIDEKDRYLRRLDLPDEIAYDKELHERTGKFHLSKSDIKSWLSLELLLTDVVKQVYQNRPLALSIHQPLPPSEYGYMQGYRTIEELRTRVRESRRAFILYLAWVQFSVITDEDVGRVNFDRSENEWPLWVVNGVKSKAFTLDRIGALFFSQAFDFTRQMRVGFFIEAAFCTFLQYIILFLRYGIPFTMVWPSSSLRQQGEDIIDSTSLPKEVKTALTVSWEEHPSVWGNISTPAPVTYDHWLPYFLQVQKANIEKKKEAMDKGEHGLLQKWEARRIEARRRVDYREAQPRSRVFFWSELEDGKLVRTNVEPKKNDFFCDHGRYEKVFDECENVWDLCKFMAKGLPTPPCAPDEDGEDEDNTLPLPLYTPVPDDLLRPYLKHPLYPQYLAQYEADLLAIENLKPPASPHPTPERRSDVDQRGSPKRPRSRSRSPRRHPRSQTSENARDVPFHALAPGSSRRRGYGGN